MSDAIKLGFIAECLQNYMRDVKRAMERQIQRSKAVDTGHLLGSISYRAYQQNAEGNASLSFAEWGRFLDMGVTKGHPIGGPGRLLDILDAKQKTVKPRKIYSPIAYGHLNGLMGDLSYGFTEEAIARIKGAIEPQNNANNA